MAWWIHSFTNLFEQLSKESMFKLLFDSEAKHWKASSEANQTILFWLLFIHRQQSMYKYKCISTDKVYILWRINISICFIRYHLQYYVVIWLYSNHLFVWLLIKNYKVQSVQFRMSPCMWDGNISSSVLVIFRPGVYQPVIKGTQNLSGGLRGGPPFYQTAWLFT